MRVNPCHGCNDRNERCHGSCGAYLSCAAERQALNKKRQDEDKVLADVNDIHALSVKRVKNGQEATRRKRKEKNR